MDIKYATHQHRVALQHAIKFECQDSAENNFAICNRNKVFYFVAQNEE